MNTTNDQREPTDDDELETQRSIIRESLDEFAEELSVAMRAANLHYPIGLTVPHSGEAFVTMVTPVDPSDDDWSQGNSDRSSDRTQEAGWETAAESTANLCNGERADECRRNNAQHARVRHALIVCPNGSSVVL